MRFKSQFDVSGVSEITSTFFCSRPEPTNFLIKNNASVSAVDKVNRNTPLHCAVLAGNVDAAHILLEAGASVDAENINVSFTELNLKCLFVFSPAVTLSDT